MPSGPSQLFWCPSPSTRGRRPSPAALICRQPWRGVARAQGRSRRPLQQSALVLRRAATSGELTLEWREERGLGHEPFKRCNEEPVEVVRRTQHLFTLADQLEARLTAARKVVDRLATLLRECGALSERARFRAQLALELARGAIREISEDGQAWLEAVG
ncbi:MAG: hypothetical protein ACK6DG_01015 [Cyanobacteriota bacterium]